MDGRISQTVPTKFGLAKLEVDDAFEQSLLRLDSECSSSLPPRRQRVREEVLNEMRRSSQCAAYSADEILHLDLIYAQ